MTIFTEMCLLSVIADGHVISITMQLRYVKNSEKKTTYTTHNLIPLWTDSKYIKPKQPLKNKYFVFLSGWMLLHLKTSASPIPNYPILLTIH
jgi:hypothetical protein